MRLTACYRVIKRAGYFWGPQFFAYRRRFGGYRSPAGLGRQFRRYSWRLGDGMWALGVTARGFFGAPKKLQMARFRNMAYGLVRLATPSLNPLWPWAWAVLRYLRVRTYRGWRYRAALSARGGRTHTNSATAGRVKDAASRLIRQSHWVKRLWEARKHKVVIARPLYKSVSKRALKAVRYKRGVVRVKKKLDVWR